MKYSNPARRLHTILMSGREKADHVACKSVWGSLLEADPGSPELLRKLARVMMLPEQILDIVEVEFPSRKAIQKHWVDPVKRAFESQNLSSEWKTFNVHIQESVVDFLAMTSDLIEERVTPEDIGEDDLARVGEQLESLQRTIIDSDLPANVKSHMHKSISRLLLALHDYKISGSSEMLAGMDMAIGRAIYDSEYKEVLSKTEVGQQFISALHAVGSLVTVATGAPMLAAGLGKLIGG